MSEALTASAKHVYLDIVGFTRDRSVEAQTEIIGVLNAVVEQSLGDLALDNETRILLPTGDGICIVLLNIDDPYDAHIQLALGILKRIAEHNTTTSDRMRQFEVRIGINSNIDNLVTDVNGNRNVAGAGINMAQRIMSQADGGQVLVGHSVFEVLQNREAYMDTFRSFTAKGKHSIQFPVHQYIGGDCPRLDTSVPTAFQQRKQAEPKLTELAAYMIGIAMQNRDIFVQYRGKETGHSSSLVWLWYAAKDEQGIFTVDRH